MKNKRACQEILKDVNNIENNVSSNGYLYKKLGRQINSIRAIVKKLLIEENNKY